MRETMSPFLFSIVRTKVQVEERAIKKHERTKDFLRSIAFKYALCARSLRISNFSVVFASMKRRNGSKTEATRADLFQVTFNYAYTTDLIQTLEGKQLG